jgi:hypothetical protein
MKQTWVVLCVVLTVLAAGVMAVDVPQKGPEKITLDGGQRGTVHFPHRKHQTTLNNCKICHDIFPQKLGVIKDLKDQGQLEKKRVMNHCRDCHRSRSKERKKAGPTSCRKCHSK